MNRLKLLLPVSFLVSLSRVFGTCLLGCGAHVQQSEGKLLLFNKTYSDAKNARCLDGSPAGFYWDVGSSAQADKWIIFLEGTYCVITVDPC